MKKLIIILLLICIQAIAEEGPFFIMKEVNLSSENLIEKGIAFIDYQKLNYPDLIPCIIALAINDTEREIFKRDVWYFKDYKVMFIAGISQSYPFDPGNNMPPYELPDPMPPVDPAPTEPEEGEPVPVVWTNLIGIEADGNNLTKTADSSWYNSTAESTKWINGDGGVVFTSRSKSASDKVEKDVFIGLSSTPSSYHYSSMDYTFQLRKQRYYINKQGVTSVSKQPYLAGWVFKVLREGEIVKFIVDDILVHQYEVVSDIPLKVDCTMHPNGGKIYDVMIVGGE